MGAPDSRTCIAALLLPVLLAFGCSTPAVRGEFAERQRLAQATDEYLLAPPTAPPTAESDLQDILIFAARNDPRVRAAYFEWVAAVHQVVPARSLPDPRLTFEADIADAVMSAMPGLMAELPWPSRLAAMGEAAVAASEVKYHEFSAAVLRALFSAKSAYYQLRALEESLAVDRRMLRLLEEIERIAAAQNAAGRATLQDVLRAQIEQEQMSTEIRNLEDSRQSAAARYRAALGVPPSTNSVPLPIRFEESRPPPEPDAIWKAAVDHNPVLRSMEAEIRRAEAEVRVAERMGRPDLSFGIEVDTRASPLMVTPSVGVTLPIWRDKLAAQITAAQAGAQAARARYTAAEFELAAEFAAQYFAYTQARRNSTLLQSELLPRARQALEVARSAYINGQSGFIDVLDSQRALLAFERALVIARTDHAIALAALSLTITGAAPESVRFGEHSQQLRVDE